MKGKTMNVIAHPGTQCPQESDPRKYISDSEAVEVEETPYYRRLINDGSLRIVTGDESRATSKKKTEGKSNVI